MSTEYIYSISNNFPHQKADLDRLTDEIEGSVISKKLEYIKTNSVYCTIIFEEELTGGEETTLSGVISSHSGEEFEFKYDDIIYVESESELSTTSTSWQQKLRATISGVPFDRYELRWYFEYRE